LGPNRATALHSQASADRSSGSALAWLCNAVARFGHNPTATRARDMVMAADADRQVPDG